MRMTENAPFAASGPARGGVLPGRLLAALLMGVVLLLLSALIHAAAAATLGGGWRSLGMLWLAAILATVIAVGRARSRVGAWRRMCLLNGIASLGLLAAGAADLAEPGAAPDLLWPTGPVLGFAVASAVLTVAGLFLAVLFFAVWHVLSRHDSGSEEPA